MNVSHTFYLRPVSTGQNSGEGIESLLLLEKGSIVAGPVNDDPGSLCCLTERNKKSKIRKMI